MANIDLTKNEKQITFFNEVMMRVAGKSSKIAFFYGGAIRGGKTFVQMFILLILCKLYPGSKWYIVRESWTKLKDTSIPSMQKLLKGSTFVKRWKRSSGDYFVEFHNGSRIYFFSENYSNNKDGENFLGLECSGFLLEQIEELQKQTFDLCLSRSGSEYLEGEQAPAILMANFNPTYNWVKEDIHDPWIEGKLDPDYLYINATPKDNPYVTEDQWKAWSKLSIDFRKKMIDGSWDIEISGQFMKSFSEVRNLAFGLEYDPVYPVWLVFDFNVDPMTCTAFQTDAYTFAHTLKEFRLENSDVIKTCEKIKEYFAGKNPYFIIGGDASGRARHAGIPGQLNMYHQIFRALGISATEDNFKVPTANPSISDSYNFCNSVIENFPSYLIDKDKCPYLIKDMRFVLKGVDGSGKMKIQKTGPNKFAGMSNEKLGHLLDNTRYFMHAALPHFVNVPKS